MIRLAVPSDCARVFKLVRRADGEQRSHAVFERAYTDRLDDASQLCFVLEDAAGQVMGFAALTRDDSQNVAGSMRISSLVISPGVRSLRSFFMVQACRIADAMGFGYVAARPQLEARCA